MQHHSLQAVPPIPGFHGTYTMFDQFHVSPRGTFGAGIYFADEPCARNYAQGVLMACDVYLVHPYRYDARFDHEVDLDSPAVGLIIALFTEDSAQQLLAESMATDARFGHDVRERLMQLGYDGLIATYEDGSQEIVAFHPNQVVIQSIQALPAA